MGVPSSAIVFSGERGEQGGSNRGAAYSEPVMRRGGFLDTAAQMRDYALAKREEEKKKQEAAKENLNKLIISTPSVWDKDQVEINKLVDDYHAYLEGLDLSDLTFKDQMEIAKKESEIKRKTQMAKENEQIYNANKDFFDKDALKNNYDKDDALNNIFNPIVNATSIEERNRIAKSASPKPNIPVVDMVNEAAKFVEELPMKGNMKGKSRQSFLEVLDSLFENDAAYKAALKTYSGGDPAKQQEFKDKMMNVFDSIYKPTPLPVTKQSSSGSASKATSAGGEKSSEVSFSGNMATYKGVTYGVGKNTWTGSSTAPGFSQDVTWNTFVIPKKSVFVPFVDEAGNQSQGNVDISEFFIGPSGIVASGTVDGQRVFVAYDSNNKAKLDFVAGNNVNEIFLKINQQSMPVKFVGITDKTKFNG